MGEKITEGLTVRRIPREHPCEHAAPNRAVRASRRGRIRVVDALIDEIVAAPTRAALVAATRALDRVLLWHHFVVPQFHSRTFRVAYWDRFGRPAITPNYGVGFFSWWIDPAEDAALKAAPGKKK